MEQLTGILSARESGNPLPTCVQNAQYHLCMEDNLAMLFLSYWYEEGKPFQIAVRNAKEGVEGCSVISFRDVNGESLRLIHKAHTYCNARIYAVWQEATVEVKL